MNTKTNQIEQRRFRWHRACDVLNAQGNLSTVATATATSAATDIVNGVHFIRDVNCESTLHAIRQSLLDGVEFCVHGEPLSAIRADNHSKKFAKNKIRRQDSSVEEDAYLQCMSSGSDGKPKRIRRSHLSWINSFRLTTKDANLSSADHYAVVGRASHSLALYAILEAAWIGANVHALSDLRPDKQLSAITQLKSSVMYATPTQLRMLCNYTGQSVQANSHMQRIFCGGGKLDAHTASLLAKHFPNATVKEFYGASETSFITISDSTTPIESVGKLYPEVQLKIMPVDVGTDNDSAEELDRGKVGEIWVKSPYLFEHYSDGCGHDTRWHNGFLCIGEMGYIDQRNNLYLTGRRSRMINVADNMVYPEQVENLLNTHEGVRHCAVIAADDAKRGSVLIAIIEKSNDKLITASSDSTLGAELLRTCRKQLGPLKAPRKIIFADSIPMLATGKPDLQTIAKQFG